MELNNLELLKNLKMSNENLNQKETLKILKILCKNHNNISTELIYHNQFQFSLPSCICPLNQLTKVLIM